MKFYGFMGTEEENPTKVIYAVFVKPGIILKER
jgi:hypothetical protein